MIEIAKLSFRYPRSFFELQIDSLRVESAAATAVVGPSGSGKTTLLHLIGGILSPDSGSITVDGTDLTALTDSARRSFRLTNIGMVFQNFELIEYLNVLDNVLLPCRISKDLPLSSELRDRASGLLQSVALERHARKPVTKLSQGERQRVAICRALLTKPGLILADEPTGNLDPLTSEQILKLLLEAVRAEGATLVMVTHDHSLLQHFSQKVDFAQFLTAPAEEPAESQV